MSEKAPKVVVTGERLNLEDELETKFHQEEDSNRQWVTLTYRNIEVKKRIPSHILKMTGENRDFHIGQIMTEMEMTMGQRLGIKSKYIHDALVRQATH